MGTVWINNCISERLTASLRYHLPLRVNPMIACVEEGRLVLPLGYYPLGEIRVRREEPPVRWECRWGETINNTACLDLGLSNAAAFADMADVLCRVKLQPHQNIDQYGYSLRPVRTH